MFFYQSIQNEGACSLVFLVARVKRIDDILNNLYKLERSGIKYSLDNITRLMAGLGNPHKKLKIVHIAGTNGKGAVASFAASILQENGFKTGLFTSPHILKFNERIRINGKTIPDRYIKDFVKKNKKLIDNVKPSFFEVNTAIAFKYFADKKVDVAVIEAGLGGRLDSTNIIIPVVSVITEIGIDHTDYLGRTIKEIAEEKAAIIKPGIPAIISDTHKGLRPIFKNRRTNSDIFFLDEIAGYRIVNTRLNGSLFTIPGIRDTFEIPLTGDYQVRNAVTAIAAAEVFFRETGYKPVSAKQFKKGLMNVKRNTGYRCRLEFLKHRNKHWILDISHNPDGIKAVMNSAKPLLRKFRKRVVIFGMMKDKEYRASLKALADLADFLILTKPDYERAMAPETLLKYARMNGLDMKAGICIAGSVNDAIEKAQEITGKRDVILVIGSFFLVSDVIKVAGIAMH